MERSSGKTALFFGSFDPVHIGHLIIAEYVLNLDDISEIWFVLSPRNPFKTQQNKAHEKHRLKMLTEAIETTQGFSVCDIEFSLPTPNYTVITLEKLRSVHAEREFVLLIGADNLLEFHLWKDYERILQLVSVYVYPRKGLRITEETLFENVQIIDAPLIELSSSYIRKNLTEGKSVRFMLHESTYNYIVITGLYRNDIL